MTAATASVWRRIRQISTRTAAYGEHGGPVRDVVDDPDNLRGMECRHLLILVHGYNNTTTQATQSFVKQIGLLKNYFRKSRYAPDAIAFFHWPGNYGVRGLSLMGYPADIERAIDSADRLAGYLANFPRPADPGAFKVTIIGHSLGCRLILEMLTRLPNELSPNVQVVSLMAPAVPIELVDTAGALQNAVLPPRNLLKCYSHQDLALWLGFPKMQWAAYKLGIEQQNYQEAVGLYGNPISIRRGVQTYHGHSDYWDDDDLANEYLALIDPTRPSPRTPVRAERRSLAERVEPLTRQLGRRRL
jgi:pimeloyl-ACP methyl ester carboxylesterase